VKIPGGRWRLLIPVVLLAFAGVMIWWRGPDWHAVGGAFTRVRWAWVVAAIGLNLLSVITRAACWNTVIKQAMPKPRPGLSRTRTTVTGREPKTEYHRQVTVAAWIVAALP